MPSILGDTESGNYGNSSYSKLDIRYINQTGDKVEGDLNMNFNKIINLPTPVNLGDAANKDFVLIAQKMSLNTLPKFYGFELSKSVTQNDYKTLIKFILPVGTNPNSVGLHISSPYLVDVRHKTLTTSGVRLKTEVRYELVFAQQLSQYSVTIEGIVIVYPTSLLKLRGKILRLELDTETPLIEVEEAEELYAETVDTVVTDL